jgi:hypothetical protein
VHGLGSANHPCKGDKDDGHYQQTKYPFHVTLLFSFRWLLTVFDIFDAGAKIDMEDVAIYNDRGDGFYPGTLRLGDTAPLLTDIHDLYITY